MRLLMMLKARGRHHPVQDHDDCVCGRTIRRNLDPSIRPRNHGPSTRAGLLRARPLRFAAELIPLCAGDAETGGFGDPGRPLRFCGVARDKPTYRLLPGRPPGVNVFVDALDTVGLFACRRPRIWPTDFTSAMTGRPQLRGRLDANPAHRSGDADFGREPEASAGRLCGIALLRGTPGAVGFATLALPEILA